MQLNRTPANDKPVRVLVVDDDGGSRRVMARSLRAFGMEVVECAEPELALELARAHQPDIALIDLHMPQMNGLELAARLGEEQPAGVHSFLVTGDTTIGFTPESLNNPAILGIFYKPMVMLEVAEALRQSRQAPPPTTPGPRAEDEPRYLIIDSDSVDRAQVDILFRRSGLEHGAREAVSSLAEALELLPKRRFTHIITNAALPDASGRDVVLRLRSCAPDATLILLADEDDERAAESALRSGADEYLCRDDIDGASFGRVLRHAVDRRRAQRELVHASQHDPVTQLGNSKLFHDQLERHLAELGPQRRSALALLKLVSFDRIAATLGRERSDRLLATLAGVLSTAPESEAVGYLGGECFAVVLKRRAAQSEPGAAGSWTGEVETLIERALEAVEDVTSGVNPELRAGVVELGRERLGATGSLSAAYVALEEAMYVEAVTRLFDAELASKAERRRVLERELQGAIARQEISLHYQPKLDLSNGAVEGVEALMRWHLREKEHVSPGEFIPLLERNGQIRDFGLWALNAACAQAVRWQQATGKLTTVAVNLSARQLHDANLIDTVRTVLRVTGLPAAGLQLEVTESSLVDNVDVCLELMNELKALGVKLAIDDFGVGYSSMAYLRLFPFDYLKIDRSFVTDLEVDSRSRAVAAGIVGLAHALGMKVVAEGIETQAQLVLLSAMRCDFAQGFLLGRPAPAHEVNFDARNLNQ